MNNRIRRFLVLASMGGMTFTFGFIGCSPFTDPYIDFAAALGNSAVAVGVDNALDVIGNEDLTAFIRDPLVDLSQDLWTGWLNLQFPNDPTYDVLLVD